MSESKTISIIGAGLAGSLLSIYLARRGYAVSVYEGRPDMRRETLPAGRSINLALAERGITALRKVGVEKEVGELVIPMAGRLLHDRKGELTFQPYGKDESEQIYSVSRELLTVALMDCAESRHGVEFRFRQRCTNVQWETSELNMLDETSGDSYSIPMAPSIAADGAGSVIRHSMVKHQGIEASEDFLEHSYKELTIPPDGDGEHAIEINALHVWPRGEFMLIALPNIDGSFTATLFMPTEGPTSFASLTDEKSVLSFFAREFPDTLSLIPNLSRDFFANPTGLMGTVRAAPWFVGGKVCLLGDAAHSIVPFHGQGMNCAFEDCRVLDELLQEDATDWNTVFDRFFHSRKPDTDAIAAMAIENYVEMRETVRSPVFHLKKAIAWELERRLPDRFIPRYSMVMFHDEIPYSEAYRRGEIQAKLLDELADGLTDVDEVDFELAEKLVMERLTPL